MIKGLEALEEIYNSLINDIEQEADEFYNPSDDIKYWEEKYNYVKKELKTLEMLKKKMTIETDYYDSDFGCEVFEYIAYNGVLLNIETEEEFDLLKEVLENE